MDISLLAGISAIITIAAYMPYIRLIIVDGSVKPNRASWFVWWVIDGSMAWVLYSAQVWSAFLLFATFTLGTTIVLLLSLRQGEGQFTRSDWLYMILAIVGIVLWRASSNENISVFANMFVATMGTIPTIKKGYKDPVSEDQLTWILFWVGGFFNILAIENWTFVDAGATLVVWMLQWGINLALIMGKRKKSSLRTIERENGARTKVLALFCFKYLLE